MKTYRLILCFLLCAFCFLLAGCGWKKERWRFDPRPQKKPVALTPIPPQPPVPPGAESYAIMARPAERTAAAVILPLVADRLVTWNYAVPMPAPNIVFEVWRTADVLQPFSLFAVTNQPPVPIPIGFYICRATNILTAKVSDWNVK